MKDSQGGETKTPTGPEAPRPEVLPPEIPHALLATIAAEHGLDVGDAHVRIVDGHEILEVGLGLGNTYGVYLGPLDAPEAVMRLDIAAIARSMRLHEGGWLVVQEGATCKHCEAGIIEAVDRETRRYACSLGQWHDFPTNGVDEHGPRFEDAHEPALAELRLAALNVKLEIARIFEEQDSRMHHGAGEIDIRAFRAMRDRVLTQLQRLST